MKLRSHEAVAWHSISLCKTAGACNKRLGHVYRQTGKHSTAQHSRAGILVYLHCQHGCRGERPLGQCHQGGLVGAPRPAACPASWQHAEMQWGRGLKALASA